MRFRGLPRHLNCGPVNLELATPDVAGPLLPVCGPCGFVSVSYYILSGCGHVLCDSCALVFSEKEGENEEELDYSCCSVCSETSEVTTMKISLTALEKIQFLCPCGIDGTLKELRLHRRRCRELQRAPPALADRGDFGAAMSPTSSEGSSRTVDADSVAAKVKEMLLEELQRVEEDILNRLELRRAPTDVQIRGLLRRIEMLETQAATIRADFHRQIAQTRTAAAINEEVQLNSRAVETLDQRVSQLAGMSVSTQQDVSKLLASRQAQSVLLWFNIKKLLQTLNRHGGPAGSDAQNVLIGGYPCRVHVQVDFVEHRKMLGIFVGTSNIRNEAEWPMKRRLHFRIYGSDGNVFIEDAVETIDVEAGDYFRGPSSAGSYGINDICTIEELTNEVFYRRNHGMLCIGIEVANL